MNIGDKLLKLRKRKGLSQEEVSNILNVSRQTVSKWETNQSTPDFDKIIPICKLYEISANELFNTNLDNIHSNDSLNNKKNNSARNISISVMLYIVSITFLIGFSCFDKPILGVCIFFIIVAFATGIIVYNSIINKKPKRKLTKNEKMEKNINEIISTIIVVIYFIVSFLSRAWYITWILFIVIGLLEGIVKLIFSIREVTEDEEK